MKWYLAKLVFRIICANGDHKPQFDEQLRLVQAEDDLHAFHKARLIGETENAGNPVPLVQWKFIDVSELHLLSEFADGAEIYSSIQEEEEPDRYMIHIQKRATQLLQNGLHQFTGLN
ncbi:MAG: DUF4288 domain-containing protein [Bacteroidetes bacterium]|nr:DUF4288 domain-containing protein [Bacteroidota bacterium]